VLVELICACAMTGEVVVCVVGHVDGGGAGGDRLHAHVQAVSGQRVGHAEHHVPGISALQQIEPRMKSSFALRYRERTQKRRI
jgi:hypothetical protein